jgi:ABC-type branched-subunit amino acid transport system substrate-binding protein
MAMKRFLLIALGVVVAGVLIFGGCKPAPPGPAAPEEIRVGVVTGLTGMFAGFGEGGVWGVRAAVEDINAEGGVYVEEYGRKLPINLIVVDSESDPTKAGTLAEDLILRSKVSFIVNAIDPPHTRAPVATVTERHKIPHVSGVGPYEAWMGLRQEVTPPWQYTWTPSFAIATPASPGDFRHGKIGYNMMDSWTNALEQIAAQTNKRVAALASDEPDGRGWYLSFSPVLKEMGWDVYRVEEEFGLVPQDTTDFTSLIEEWKDYNCETLWANCPAPFFGTMWRQAHTLGFQPKMVYATRAGLFYSDIQAWGGDLPHAVCNEMFWHPSIKESPGIGDTTPMSLHERWVEDTGQPLHQNVGYGYAVVQVLIDAIERAGTLDGEQVNEALAETDLMTIYHRVVFDEDNFSRVPVSFGQWVKTDKPWVWDNPIVISQHEFLPATADLIFPIPYD